MTPEFFVFIAIWVLIGFVSLFVREAAPEDGALRAMATGLALGALAIVVMSFAGMFVSRLF